MFHTKDRVIMLITQTHPQSKISFLHLNVHIKLLTSRESIEQCLSTINNELVNFSIECNSKSGIFRCYLHYKETDPIVAFMAQMLKAL